MNEGNKVAHGLLTTAYWTEGTKIGYQMLVPGR
jgi:hypothetical protein